MESTDVCCLKYMNRMTEQLMQELALKGHMAQPFIGKGAKMRLFPTCPTTSRKPPVMEALPCLW